jgi:hypothetical protein
MDKPLARAPLRRGRRASYVSQGAEFATNAGRRDYERRVSSLREFTIDVADRDEAPVILIRARTVPFQGTIWSQSSEPSLEIFLVSFCFNW